MRLIYGEEAEDEVAEAAQYYESKVEGLGIRFLNDFDATIAEIRDNPTLWPKLERDLRSKTMKSFPFSVIYRVEQDALRILVLKHHSRHPDYGRRLDDPG